MALGISPDLPEAYNNLRECVAGNGDAAEAEAAFRRSIELGGRIGGWNLSFMLLVRGEFEEGWPAYEARLRMSGFPVRKFSQPMWSGEDLGRRTILLHGNRGWGTRSSSSGTRRW